MNDSTDELVYTAFTNSESGEKDITVGTIDKIIATGAHEHIFYAQSETNILASRGNSTDYYNVYLDERTSITDAGGNDTLSVLNTGAYHDGEKSNIHFMFNVSNSYSYDGTAETLFTGNILVTDDNSKYNYDCWKEGTTFKGISVDNNTVETVVSADKYSITNAQLSTLAGSVASWLNTEGYANVNGVFSNAQGKADDNAADIATLIAKFDTAAWNNPS